MLAKTQLPDFSACVYPGGSRSAGDREGSTPNGDIAFSKVPKPVSFTLSPPLVDFTEAARAVSEAHVDRRVAVKTSRRDEIADLARSFEMLRRSLVTAMKRMQRKG